MKTNFHLYPILFLLSFFLGLSACEDGDLSSPTPAGETLNTTSTFDSGGRSGGGGGGSSPGTNPGNPDLAGLLTAGEWNDRDNWDFWRTLVQKDSIRRAYEKWDMPVNYLPRPYAPNPRPGQNYQIAFIVDATGSMGDEITYLQSDLVSLLTEVRAKHANYDLETGFVFYRDQGDDYLTRHLGFTRNAGVAAEWLKAQRADGGGDFPEAVHSGLEAGLRDLQWSSSPGSRIAFLLLDAPPHDDEKTKASYRQLVREYRERGIRIIPLAASGINLETEMLLRLTALATNGTYTFLTNHSGIGNPHLEPSIGEYEVEILRDLLVRLIGKYGE